MLVRTFRENFALFRGLWRLARVASPFGFEKVQQMSGRKAADTRRVALPITAERRTLASATTAAIRIKVLLYLIFVDPLSVE